MSMKVLAISDFCITGSGTTPSRQESLFYNNGTIPWVKSGELREKVITNTEEHVTTLAVQKTSLKIVPEGAILLAMYGATVGRMARLGIKATTNQAVCHIIPDNSIANTDYLYLYLQYRVPDLLAQAQGGAQPNISQQLIKRIQIPLPPLAEQKRIAAILDQADALRVKRRAALARLDRLVQAVFLEMFGDPMTNPMGWEEVKLAETFKSKPQIGTAVPAHEGGKQIIVRVGELGKDYVAISDCKFVTLDGPELEKFSVKAGDYLLARAIGSEDHLGKASLMHDIKLPVVYDSHVMRLRFDSKTLLPQFFLVWMKTQGGRRRFMQRAARTAVQFNINTKQISDIDIPLPPIDKQAHFVNFYNGAQTQQERHENALQLAEKLFHALQQRAFRGEL